jgi:hypothetical protein
MPTFDQTTVSSAAPEEVWKLLYDPARFPDWWAGIGSVTTGGDTGDFTMFPDGYPDFPMPQTLETSQESGSVKISCLVSDLRFDWRLRPWGAGSGTEISAAWGGGLVECYLRPRRDPRLRSPSPQRSARHHPPVAYPPRQPRRRGAVDDGGGGPSRPGRAARSRGLASSDA